MPTLPCPRCDQPRTAHAACPACGAPGLETDVPPLPDVAVPTEAEAHAAAPLAPAHAAPVHAAAPAWPPSVDVVPRPDRSGWMARVGYFVAAILATGALVLFHGVVWGDHDEDRGAPTEEVMPPPDAPEAPAPPDVPRPPGMTDAEWEEMQRDLREAEREVEEATREVEEAVREAQREAGEAQREAGEAVREAQREAEEAAREAQREAQEAARQ